MARESMPRAGEKMSWIARPIVIFALLNLAWELLQLPFYTIWSTGTPSQITFAILHCTMGDVMIGIAAAAISRAVLTGLKPHQRSEWAFIVCFVLLALAYTVFSEWMNVHVRKSWAYSASMPLVLPFGTGLTPLLQWIIVPTLSWVAAGAPVRSRLAGRPTGVEGNPS